MDTTFYDIPGFPGYQITREAVVRNAKTGKILTVRILNTGYAAVTLPVVTASRKSNNVLLHRLVGATFLRSPAPDCTDIAHWDGNKLNNCPSNLRYCTHRENMMDRHRHGTLYQGVFGKLSQEQVLELFASQHEDAQVVADRYGISRQAVRAIWRGARWGWLTGKTYKRQRSGDYKGSKPGRSRKNNRKLTPEQAIEIYNRTETHQVLADEYGVGRATILALKSGRTWSDVTGAERRVWR